MGSVVVALGVVALFGVPLVVAAITIYATRRSVRRPMHVALLSLWLCLLLAWQMMPVVYLSGVNKATAGDGYLFVVIGGGLCGLALILWNAGRLACRIARGAGREPSFDAARSAAVMAVVYAVAFGLFAWTRDTRWTDWLRDWPPAWLSIPLTFIIATGQWRRVPLAAWAGVAFAAFTLVWLFDDPEFAKRLLRADTVFLKEPLGPLLAWLFATLLPGARRGCEPPERKRSNDPVG